MNWAKYVVEYGDMVTIMLLMLSLIGALAIVLRGFQAQRMRRNVLSISGLVLCSVCIFGSLRYMRTLAPKMESLKPLFRGEGQTVPDMVFTSLSDNSTHHLAEFNGKVVVLNFFATWCAACRGEMPDLQRLQQAFGDRVVVLEITDEDAEAVASYKPMATMNLIKGRMWAATGGELYVKPEVVRPVTHIIDTNGVLRDTLIGQQSYQQFSTEVVRYLIPKS